MVPSKILKVLIGMTDDETQQIVQFHWVSSSYSMGFSTLWRPVLKDETNSHSPNLGHCSLVLILAVTEQRGNNCEH